MSQVDRFCMRGAPRSLAFECGFIKSMLANSKSVTHSLHRDLLLCGLTTYPSHTIGFDPSLTIALETKNER